MGRNKRSQKQVEAGKKKKKFEEEDHGESGSSGDEMPEVVSNKAMKEDQEQILKELEYLKQQLRQQEKAKRRQKQDIFIAQKKIKLDKSGAAEVEETEAPSSQQSLSIPHEQPAKKVYKSLNITVEPLTKVGNCRASSALDFKSKRLAKAPRESIKSAVISYQKKLLARQ